MTTERSGSIDRALAVGMAWTGGVRWATSLITWGLTLTTARLLAPADYGVMGMAIVCMGFAQLVADLGLNAAVVQAPELREPLAARIGGAALMLATGVAALTIGVAPLLAAFFGEPEVRWVITALSITFLLRGIQILRRALLARAMRFKTVAFAEAGEQVVAAVVALTCASLGFGYWSLVAGLVSGAFVSTIVLVLVMPHRIELPRKIGDLRGALKFGSQVLGAHVAWYAYTTADMVVVGRLLGPTALGAYTFAWVIGGFAVERIAALSGKVTPAIFSAVQRDHTAVRRYIYALTEALAFITMPLCIGVAITADLIVRVALGPAWTAAIVPMRILAIYAAVRCVVVIFPQVLVYVGRARQSMQYNVIALMILVPLFIMAGTKWNTVGVAMVWVLVFPFLTAFTYFRELRKAVSLSTRAYLRALRPAATATLAMIAVVLAARETWGESAPGLVELITSVSLGALAYAAVVVGLYRRRFVHVMRLFRGGAPRSATDPAAPKGRLLLVCYHYPPDPAIGALRWQKFTRHAAARGWGVDVIMRDPAAIPNADPERLRDLPPGVVRIGVADRPFWFDELERRAAKLYRRFRPPTIAVDSLRAEEVSRPRSGRDLVRAYFAVIAYLRMRRWAADAARAAEGLLDRNVHRAIVACGPPFSACLAGRTLATRTGLPLIIDLRDPWGSPQRLPEATASPLTLMLNRRAEARAVGAAALVVANSTPVGDDMRARYPRARVIDVPNGYDEEDVPLGTPRPKFIIAYAGTIYLDRDPTMLFRAVKQVVDARGLTPAELSIEFMGAVTGGEGRSLADRAREAGIESFVIEHGTRPRREALAFLSKASMLVMLQQDADMVIQGKLYEYMLFDSWLLALAEKDSATARLLSGSDADVVSGADSEAMARVILQRYDEYRAGVRAVPLAIDQRFSRAARAATFFAQLDQVVQIAPASAAPPPPARQPALTAR
jgi:teichuronic acid exporter